MDKHTVTTTTTTGASPEELAPAPDLQAHVCRELRVLAQAIDTLADRIEEADSPRLACLARLAVCVEQAGGKLFKAGRCV